MAEDWSMKRDGDIWLHDGFTRPNLRYGDSIMIRATRNSTFVWNNPLTTPVVTDPQKPRYFTYLDKADYETIMIEAIEGNPEYSEIGIYQDEVCIGARVNEAYPIQILAYSTPENEGGGELSFRLYSENKELLFASPASMNPNNDDILMPEFRGFRSFTLKTSEDQVPPNLILHANYPNPFNPTTTISFSLPCTAKVKLCIYNVKGQRINEIISRTMESGKHSIIWNGKDERGRGVGSGIYFAKLEQNGQTKISKMMLMK